ncbi:hypothetical protein V1478_012689 [Vespula squamosa]|uniref:Uncharacterized protein n=1 Tax=Vespula squamosa TaxID=30214 RepID=A0ABD2A8P3_VESSQ
MSESKIFSNLLDFKGRISLLRIKKPTKREICIYVLADSNTRYIHFIHTMTVLLQNHGYILISQFQS